MAQRRHEFGAQGGLDLFEDFLLHRVEVEHALDHIHRELLGQRGEHLAGVVGGDLGEHHRDGLRVFVLEVGGEDVLLHVGELLPHVAAGGSADFFHDRIDAIGRKEAQQKALRRFGIAGDGAFRADGGDELGKQRVEHLLGDRAHAHHGAREHLDLDLVELLEDRPAEIGAQGEQQHGGLLVSGEVALRGVAADDELGKRMIELLGRGAAMDYAAPVLVIQSRTISAACLGFSSTRVPTVLRVAAWASPCERALAIQAGICRAAAARRPRPSAGRARREPCPARRGP